MGLGTFQGRSESLRGSAGGSVSGWTSALVVLVAATVVALVDTRAGIGPWVQLREEAQTARARVAAREAEVARLATEIAELSENRIALERAIREELDLARAGEWVVRFRAADPPGRARAGSATGPELP